MKWFDRKFTFDLPLYLFPNIVERLRGTPARLEERVAGLSKAILTTKPGDGWSIQENVGHLLDLEPLWAGRVDEFIAGKDVLMAADLTNRKTHQANHNARKIRELLAEFRKARENLVRALDSVDEALVARTAKHPRLGTPMRLIDHAFFVAEHDDHHLTTIGRLIRG
jgi:uncharacterized damage-inducible protein DinB